LAITLCYLTTGNSQISLSFEFRVGRSTICSIIRDTCLALWESLQPEFVRAPSSEEDWKGISSEFYKSWNFPNCIGAIDGKHVTIQCPQGAGSTYYNYKGSHSIVLIAVCDAHYRFIIVDIGDAGRNSDGGVLTSSTFGQTLEAGNLAIPSPRQLPDSATEAPFMFVGDETFPLRVNMLRPYPGKKLPDPETIYSTIV
jgi:hypothetical protein